MARFVDRLQEIRELNALLSGEAGQLAIVFGRRRVGKTTLLLHWVQRTAADSLLIDLESLDADLRAALARA